MSVAQPTGFFSVTGYDQQQHYKDRGPTWIKLYNRLLDDYQFSMLPDAAKWHLIGIFLLASRHNNRIPCDPGWLARQIGAVSPVELAPLERAGFIAPVEEPPFCADVAAAFDLFANPASPEKKEEKRKEDKNREEKTLLSAGADPSKLSEANSEDKKNAYPEDFQSFWTGYPTDPLMSKKKAFEIWRRMSAADKSAAQLALPAFREFIKRQVNYRTVHAQRYLSERRYEGFAAQAPPDAQAIAAAKDRADRLLKRGKYAEKYS